MREIQLTDIIGAQWGHADNQEAGTGCTVMLTPQGAPCGVDVRGGGPATREVELLKPSSTAAGIHGLLLAGGSAFGLSAADGVMSYLKKQGVGVDVGVAKVPLVVQTNIFDLDYKESNIYPDRFMAHSACEDAELRSATHKPLPQGSIGVGTGATVGKAQGPMHAMKAGIGHYAAEVGPIQVGALAVCNAIGDVFDIDTGTQLAGMRDDDGSFISTEQYLYDMMAGKVAPPTAHTNTTLGILVTNVKMDKTALTKLASMTQNGLARTIRPVHTSFDGDAVFAVSLGNVELPALAIDGVGSLAAYVMGKAINNASLTVCGKASSEITRV